MMNNVFMPLRCTPYLNGEVWFLKLKVFIALWSVCCTAISAYWQLKCIHVFRNLKMVHEVWMTLQDLWWLQNALMSLRLSCVTLITLNWKKWLWKLCEQWFNLAYHPPRTGLPQNVHNTSTTKLAPEQNKN